MEKDRSLGPKLMVSQKLVALMGQDSSLRKMYLQALDHKAASQSYKDNSSLGQYAKNKRRPRLEQAAVEEEIKEKLDEDEEASVVQA